MDNQHRKITGYRELSQAEIDLMNEIKAEGARLQTLITTVHAFNEAREPDPDAPFSMSTDPLRWLEIARTDLQTGLMALTRAVAAPRFF